MTPKEAQAEIDRKKNWQIQNCKNLCIDKKLDYDMVLKMVNVLSCIVPAEQCSACFRVVFEILDLLPKPMIVTPFPIGPKLPPSLYLTEEQEEVMDKLVEDLKSGKLIIREK